MTPFCLPALVLWLALGCGLFALAAYTAPLSDDDE